MTTKMGECLYLHTLGLAHKFFLNINYKLRKSSNKLNNNINTTLISLITLTILIISSMSWLVLRTLKEGRKALTEIDKDRSKTSQKII